MPTKKIDYAKHSVNETKNTSLLDLIKKNARTKQDAEKERLEYVENEKKKYEARIIREIGEPLRKLLKNDIICRSNNGELSDGMICGTISYSNYPAGTWPSNWHELEGIESDLDENYRPCCPKIGFVVPASSCVHVCVEVKGWFSRHYKHTIEIPDNVKMGYDYLKKYADANGIFLGSIYIYETVQKYGESKKKIRRDATNDATKIVYESGTERYWVESSWFIDYKIKL